MDEPSPTRRRLLLLAPAAVLAVGLAGAGAWLLSAEEPPVPIGGPFRLQDGTGRTVTEQEFRGRWMLVYFGYTHCPDVCPTTLADWARVRGQLGDDADGVRFVFVSVDPERDDPARSMAYARQFDPSFVGLTADRAGLPTLLRDWRISAPAPCPVSSGRTPRMLADTGCASSVQSTEVPSGFGAPGAVLSVMWSDSTDRMIASLRAQEPIRLVDRRRHRTGGRADEALYAPGQLRCPDRSQAPSR